MGISSIEDLRSILEEECNGQQKKRLGDKTLATLGDLLARPGMAAVGTISALAKDSGVDPSTLTRLGKRLGLSGFSELQDIFRRHVAQTQPFYSNRVQERIAETRDGGSLSEQQQHVHAECRKMLATVAALDPALVERAAHLLVKAEHVYVLALRATYALSYFLGTYLGTFRHNVTILGGPGFALASEISHITPNDVLVAISFRPYTKAVIAAVDVVRESGTPILALTESRSALQVEPENGLVLPIDQPFYFDSSTAHFFVIQTLLLATARRLGVQAVDIAQRREQIYRSLDMEVF